MSSSNLKDIQFTLKCYIKGGNCHFKEMEAINPELVETAKNNLGEYIVLFLQEKDVRKNKCWYRMACPYLEILQLSTRHMHYKVFQATNLRGFCASMNPKFEGGIPDFMDGISNFTDGTPDFMENFNTF